jgi:hypothetical protein
MKRFLLAVSCFLLLAVGPSVSTAGAASVISNSALMPQTTSRQQIVDEFKRRLAKIDSSAQPLASGYTYFTDIGKNGVDEWVTNYNEKQLGDAEGKGRIAVFDTNRTRAEKSSHDAGSVSATLEIQTRCYHLRDTTPAEARQHLSDMAQAVITDPDTGETDLRLGGLAVDIQISNDGFVIPNEVFTIEASAIGWTITQEIDPYEQ